MPALPGAPLTGLPEARLSEYRFCPRGSRPAGLMKLASSMLPTTEGTVAPGSAGMGTVMQGYVETSNVNVVQELVTMIQTQRAYEMNSKAIQTSDQMLQRLAQL